MSKYQDWNNFKNILCIRTDNMGDVIMTAPAIKALKDAVPERKITLLASPAGAAIVKHLSGIDDLIVFDTPWTKTNESTSVDQLYELILEIKKRNFDAAVIFHVYSQNPLPSAMICYQAGIPRVAGYSRENPYHLMSDWIPDPEPYQLIKHEVQRQLDLVSHLGASVQVGRLNIVISSEAEKKVAEILSHHTLMQDQEYIILHPGVSEERRQFSIDKFTKAAEKISDQLGMPMFITGSAGEIELGELIATATNGKVVNMAGKLSLEELIAFIKNAKVLITNNTGPAHIAAATQTPLLVLYAMTNPQHAPWKVKNKVLLFDVPETKRSKNTVIEFAYQLAFKNKPSEIEADDILNGVRELLADSVLTDMSKVLYL